MRKITLITLLIISSVYLFGQGEIEEKRRLSDKIFFGGGLGMQFGSITAIEVSPMIGYIPIDNLRIGTKLTYSFHKISNSDFSTNIYGASLFSMYNFFRNALVHAEIESLSLQTEAFDTYNNFPDQNRFWVHSPLIGGGYTQSMGKRSKAVFLVLFNLNQTIYSPYTNPILRIHFLF